MSSETTMIYNSRKNLLDGLSSLGYKTDEYLSFSTNEVEAMIQNNQLDMLIEYSPEVTDTAYNKTKVYVKHMLTAKAIRLKSAIE